MISMKKLGWIVALGMISVSTAWADVNLEPLLNTVTLQLHAEQWVTTQTALVNVGVNAAVSSQGIEKIQSDVMQKLNQLADKVEWHLVAFDRQLDKSGLESVQITAQARVPQTELANLRDRAKRISKPGETFTIDSIQFTPSEAEVRLANNNLRNNLYQQAKVEIDALNKVYPDQKYYLHQMDFLSQVAPMPVQTAMYKSMSANNGAAPLSVGNKVEAQATVVLAAMPDVVAQKLTHN